METRNSKFFIVGITIIGLLVYFVSLETDTKKSVERSIRKEIKTLGSISIEGNPSDIQYNSNFNLLKVVKSFSGIDACSSGWGNGSLAISGDWRIEYDASEYRDEDLKLLQDIQKKNVYDPGYAIQGKSLETTWLDAGAWDMMRLIMLYMVTRFQSIWGIVIKIKCSREPALYMEKRFML